MSGEGEEGYHLAVTTSDGWNQRNGDLFKLNRIGVHQDMAFTSAMYGCRLTGFI